MEKKICYKKLFKLMIDRDLKGHDLREKAGISQSTYFKLQHDQPVSTQMLVRICCTHNLCAYGAQIPHWQPERYFLSRTCRERK